MKNKNAPNYLGWWQPWARDRFSNKWFFPTARYIERWPKLCHYCNWQLKWDSPMPSSLDEWNITLPLNWLMLFPAEEAIFPTFCRSRASAFLTRFGGLYRQSGQQNCGPNYFVDHYQSIGVALDINIQLIID